eukprot:6122692-Amphidinium_carterae.1
MPGDICAGCLRQRCCRPFLSLRLPSSCQHRGHQKSFSGLSGYNIFNTLTRLLYVRPPHQLIAIPPLQGPWVVRRSRRGGGSEPVVGSILWAPASAA